MNTLWLIAKREFRTRTLAKANIITTLVMLAIVIIAALVGKPLLDNSEASVDQVVVSESTIELLPHLEQNAANQFAELEFVTFPDSADAAQLLEDGYLAVISGEPNSPSITMDGVENAVVSVTTAASSEYALAQAITTLGGDPEEVGAAVAQSTPEAIDLEEPQDFDPAAYIAGIVVVVILFMVLIQGASVIMMGVVEEKVSRVVEILLATVRPAQLLGGKILGIGLYSLSQAATMFLPILGAAWYMGFLEQFNVDVGLLVQNLLVWFVLGYALFAILFGSLAALVSRQEDIGAVSTPMVFLVMIPFYLAMFLVPNSPDGTAVKILTQVPFFAPFLVPVRSAFGGIATWEIVLAIAICLVCIPVLTWLSGRIYSRAVLNTGGRMKLKDALKAS